MKKEVKGIHMKNQSKGKSHQSKISIGQLLSQYTKSQLKQDYKYYKTAFGKQPSKDKTSRV